MGSVYVIRDEDSSAIQQLISSINSHANKEAPEDGIKLQILGTRMQHKKAVTPKEHLLRLFREHGVHSNERQMALGSEDQLVALQLCLAEKNKQVTGDYDVELSTVLEYDRKITERKLKLQDIGTDSEETDSEYVEARKLYEECLKASNLLDFQDVLSRVKEEVKQNQELANILKATCLVCLRQPADACEKAILEFLASEKPVYKVRAEMPLDDDKPLGEVTFDSTTLTDAFESQSREDSVLSTPTATPRTPLGTSTPAGSDATPSQQTTPSRGLSVTELYIEKILLSYLHLLVNSRSELALARVINTPERELDHKAFTKLKREAKNKNMAMYQTAMSFVMRIRLGGKSYAPDPNHPLSQHVKGMGEFVDLIQKLQTIIEEDTKTSSAVRRVINILKTTILKCRDTNLRSQSIEACANRLQEQAQALVQDYESNATISPKRDPSVGGSMAGRATLRVLRSIVDHASSQPSVSRPARFLTDNFSSQRTPVRFPSLMSQFRSPLEHSPEAPESQSLAQRMKEKFRAKIEKSKASIPRFGAHMDWAPLMDEFAPDDNIQVSPSQIDCIPSKTVVQAGAPLTKKPAFQPRRVIESIADQENVNTDDPSPLISDNCDPKPANCDTQPKKSNKRAAPESRSESSQPSKKAKKPAGPKASKKKPAPLLKGQKQMTAFFRV